MDDGLTGQETGQRLRRAPGHHRTAIGRRQRAIGRRQRAILLGGVVALTLAVLFLNGGGRTARPAVHLPSAGFFERLARLAGRGPGSFAASALDAENDAIDRTLAYTPFVRIAGSQHRELALTFDDGPGPYTPAIISILDRERVPATFFEVGFMEQYFHTSTTEIAASGDAIGDHTFAHVPMSRLSARGQRIELLAGAAALTRYGAPFPRLFRPPYGLWNSATVTLLHRYRMLMVLWTVDTGDYRRPGVKAIVRAALSGARPGAIILLHDAGGDRSQTVTALPRIIAGLRARGYRLVTVPRLLLDNPAPADQQLAQLTSGGA
jgi:peptidoglycan/xylan/chitin deacetylase (PgdA/CDA1 family)